MKVTNEKTIFHNRPPFFYFPERSSQYNPSHDFQDNVPGPQTVKKVAKLFLNK